MINILKTWMKSAFNILVSNVVKPNTSNPCSYDDNDS